jgi:Flp pilus assembly protein CpaB
MIGLLRGRALALVALALALVGLASAGGAGSAGQPRARVLVAARTIAAGTMLRASSVRTVTIAAGDRTPGMATRRAEVVGHAARVRLSSGDYVLRAAVAGGAVAIGLHAGERVVPLSVEPSAAPPLGLLPAGARIDVVAEQDADRSGPARSVLIARGLSLLEPARATDDGVAVTLRAPLAVALALATAQARSRRLRLFALPAAGADGG